MCPKICPNLTTFGVSQKIFIQTSFVKFHGNSSSNPADSYRHRIGRTDGQAGMTKLLDDLSLYTNVPNHKNVPKLSVFS